MLYKSKGCGVVAMNLSRYQQVHQTMLSLLSDCSTTKGAIAFIITSRLPWQRAATDLCELNDSTYLVILDYFSRYPEVLQLKSTTSSAVIGALKSIFNRHGIPETLVSDNLPVVMASNIQLAARIILKETV